MFSKKKIIAIQMLQLLFVCVFVLIFYNTRERSRLGLLVQRDLFWKHLCSQREIPKSLMSACTTHQLTPGVVLFGSQVSN